MNALNICNVCLLWPAIYYMAGHNVTMRQIQIQIHPSQRLHLGDQWQATSLLYSVCLLTQKCFETSLERRLIR